MFEIHLLFSTDTPHIVMIRRNPNAMQHFGFINITSADENGIKGAITTVMNVEVIFDIIR